MKLYDSKDNINFVKDVFKKQKIFLCDKFPLGFSSPSNKESNLYTRILFLFHKNAFFETSVWDKDWDYKDLNSMASREQNDYIKKWKELNPFSHNRRYICQQMIDDTIYNPIHTSIKPHSDKKIVIDFENPKEFWNNFSSRTHPGHTRISCSEFLRKRLRNSLIYVNKKYYYENMFKQKLQEITDVEQLFPLWKPFTSEKELDLGYMFIKDKAIDFNLRTKYHNKSECYVLKLWGLWDYNHKTKGKHTYSLLAGSHYLREIYNSCKDNSKTLFEKRLQIYTNSTIDVKTYFYNIREFLIDKAKEQILLPAGKPHGQVKRVVKDPAYIFDNLDKFDYDVNVVDEKPKNISKLNNYKGFAIWIDKDILYSIKRDIYEFLFFTRYDIKLAETKDGKISVVNCRNIESNNKWEIHEEFYG